ncbi:hypothetical protein Tco_0371158 [Tanacetum coccineum]
MSSSILRIMKSAGKANLPTSMSIFLAITIGYWNDQSANLTLILVGLRVLRDNSAYKEYGMRLMLAPSQSIECDHLNEIGMVLRESSFQNIRPRRFLRSGSQSNVGCKKGCQSSEYRSDLGVGCVLEEFFKLAFEWIKDVPFVDNVLILELKIDMGNLGSLLTYSIVRNPWSSLIPLSHGSFDVLVGMDQLSKRKFGIVCHKKVVRIPLEGNEILRVHGERNQGVVKTLMNTKVVEFRVDLVPGATPVVKSPYRLEPLEMQELSEQLQELQRYEVSYDIFILLWSGAPVFVSLRRGAWSSFEVRVGITEEGEVVTYLHLQRKLLKIVKPLTSRIGQMLITDALIGKERVRNLHRVRAAMSIVPVQYGMLRFTSCVWQERCRNVTDAIVKIHEYCRCKQPQAMYKVNGMIQNFGKIYEGMFIDWCSLSSNLIIPELVQETTDKVVLIKEKLKAVRDHQKSCADNRRKPLEFEVEIGLC